MSPTRRVFLKTMGIALASLVMARCAPLTGGKDQARSRLRDCWLRLDWLAERSQRGGEQGEKAKKKLTEEHRAALDSLVASGALDKAVAYHIEYAFAAAAEHVWVSSGPVVVTCYVPVEEPTSAPGPTPTVKEAASRQVASYQSGSAERLVQQADLLAEMAGQNGIDTSSVERAQQAIRWDLFFLTSVLEEREALADRLVEMAGGTYNLPPFEQWNQAVPPDVAEAARFLVELLLEE